MEQDSVEKSIWLAETTEEITQFISSLPRLSSDQLSSTDHCPICLVPLSLISSDSLDGKPNGVTKLRCGHVFCLSDISEWINTPRGSCPTCRDIFLVIPDPSEEESSDGGEYIPGSDLTDEFMEDYWTEDEEDWVDTETELFDGNTLDESNDSSWDSEQHIEEASALEHDQILSTNDFPHTVPSDFSGDFENLVEEVLQLKSNVDSIRDSDLLDETACTRETLILSWQKTKNIKRILISENSFPIPPSDIQSMLNTLQEIEDSMHNIMMAAMPGLDHAL